MILSNLVPENLFVVYGDINTYFNKPIAVLIGPQCVSMGDFASLLLSLHPKTKLFGKPTASMFNNPDGFNAESDFFFKYARSETYLLDSPGEYLTRKEFPNPKDFPWVDFEQVWLTRDGVAQGRDDVVEAALAWINPAVDVQDGTDNEKISNDFMLSQNYPNPFNSETIITFKIPYRTNIKIELFNINGQHIKTLLNEIKSHGTYHISWDGTNEQGKAVGSGIYFYRLYTDSVIQKRKMILLR